VLESIASRIAAREDFAFETTLSGRTYLKQVQALRRIDYGVHMFYLWIPSAAMAVERIRDRVESGGHNVPEPAVRRRYARTLRNLFCLYRPHLDTLHFFDNSSDEPRLVFHDNLRNVTVLDQPLYDRLLALGDRP
jgi:predicted ABC-type ATPase